MSPITPATSRGFRVILATDEQEPPTLPMIGVNVELVSTAGFLAEKPRLLKELSSSKPAVLVVATVVYFGAVLLVLRTVRRFRRRALLPIVVGKVSDQDGQPVLGAQVELMLESPKSN